MTEHDRSWDLKETEAGCRPESEDAFNLKMEEWAKRDWSAWLKTNLAFPFNAKREEDEDNEYFTDLADHEPFKLGSTMEVLEVADWEDEQSGIHVEVKQDNSRSCVPLADLEVIPTTDQNFWPVREYVVWMANH